ncbi:MAG: MBL fold metallo-hydrolase RNA specificity domain-containing protein [Eubacteriales bacterium]
MKITFVGAAHEVTGSCTLLEVGELKYLIDCGMEQGKDEFENVPLPLPPSMIEAVFVTHAHIDHSGLLPKLYKDGFKGKIYATELTHNLCEIMLRDSAHIQETEAEWQNRKAERNGTVKIEPLYTTEDAIGALSLFYPCKYDRVYPVSENISIRFTDIGHLLGSACIEVWMHEGDEDKKIVFSGDVGNLNQPLIKDPQTVDETDYLVIESTYGDRLHDGEKNSDVIVRELSNYISSTFDRGGSVIIPSFAVGRTQELLYAIRMIKEQGLLKKYGDFPVYVDSPMAVEATQVFLQCDTVCFDDETRALIEKGINPIWFEGLTLSVTADDSKLINMDTRPKVIISASGMCEAGRIRHHLKHNLWRRENLVLFVGYQAVNSLGRRLLDGARTVRLFGEDVAVKAKIASLHGMSGHADMEGLLSWLEAFKKRPYTVFVNHGDEGACENLRGLIEQRFGCRAIAPYSGSEYDLLTDTPINEPEGVKIQSSKARSKTERADRFYNELMREVGNLYDYATASRGLSNKELSSMTEQIKTMLKKWKKKK